MKLQLKIYFIALSTFGSCLYSDLHSQILYGTNQINQHLRGYFGALSLPANAPNYLHDMAAHDVDSIYFQPQHTDTLDYQLFLKMLTESKGMAYDTMLVANADSTYKYANQMGEDTIRLGIMDFDFYRVKSAAMTSNTYFIFDTVNDVLSDQPVRPGYPYDRYNACVLAPLSPSNYSSKVVYCIDPAYIFADPANSNFYNGSWANSIFKIDFADGNGWQVINTSAISYYTVQYTSATGGDVILKWDLLNTTRNTRERHKFGNAIFTTGKEDDVEESDEHFQLPGLNIGVYKGCENIRDEDRQVLIYLEGFDPLDAYPTLGRSIKSIYDGQIKTTGIEDLKRYGYDIYVVSWHNSRVDIKLNAQFVEGLLGYLNCNHPSKQPYVIMGESMGGLVARYALLEIEAGKKVGCNVDKGHNTRLLITLDSPHKGANVPLSVQFLYQDVVNNFFPMLAPDQRAALTLTHQGLEGDAVKQMLYYHANMCLNTSAPQPGLPHPMHQAFLSDLKRLGNYPTQCKTIAMSNGAMDGSGQTNAYNGNTRVANDDLLAFNSSSYINLLGLKIPIFTANLVLRTQPSGSGLVYKINAGTFGIKVKLKWWGIKVTVGYNSLINNNSRTISNGDAICTQAGGVYQIPVLNTGKVLSGMEGFSDFFFPKYSNTINNGNGSYTIKSQWTKSGWFGNNTVISSQGYHWNFVPSISALDYNTSNLGYNIESDHFSIPSNTPFKAVIGIYRNCDEWQTYINPLNPSKYPFLKNREHLTLRNDFITSDGSTWNGISGSPNSRKAIVYYDRCNYVHFLNREIGDDSLWLNNAKLTYSTRYIPEVSCFANIQNPYFKYAASVSGVTRRGAYTQTNPFQVSGSGFASLYYDSSKGGVFSAALSATQYNTVNYSQPVCCTGKRPANEGLPESPVQIKTEGLSSLGAYPNPNKGTELTVQAVLEEAGSLVITDLLGRRLWEKTLSQGDHSLILIGAEINLPQGIYMLQLVQSSKHLSLKLMINP
jgi:hypothetical protein